jgi:hypothetical protein
MSQFKGAAFGPAARFEQLGQIDWHRPGQRGPAGIIEGGRIVRRDVITKKAQRHVCLALRAD